MWQVLFLYNMTDIFCAYHLIRSHIFIENTPQGIPMNPNSICEKTNCRQLVFAILIPLAVGTLSAWLTKDSMMAFASVRQSSLTPPTWLFPLVWTILYILMGTASYLIYQKAPSSNAILFYALQLFFNFFWSIWFFNCGWYLFSFFWLLCLWVLILLTMLSFYKISKPAAYLMLPYLLWVTFAGYLNLMVYLLN